MNLIHHGGYLLDLSTLFPRNEPKQEPARLIADSMIDSSEQKRLLEGGKLSQAEANRTFNAIIQNVASLSSLFKIQALELCKVTYGDLQNLIAHTGPAVQELKNRVNQVTQELLSAIQVHSEIYKKFKENKANYVNLKTELAGLNNKDNILNKKMSSLICEERELCTILEIGSRFLSWSALKETKDAHKLIRVMQEMKILESEIASNTIKINNKKIFLHENKKKSSVLKNQLKLMDNKNKERGKAITSLQNIKSSLEELLVKYDSLKRDVEIIEIHINANALDGDWTSNFIKKVVDAHETFSAIRGAYITQGQNPTFAS